VLNCQIVLIENIYVPVKRRKTLKPHVVEKIAESILEIGQQEPVAVRPDNDRFVLVEGLHRLEACKALGEQTVQCVVVSAELASHKQVLERELGPEQAKIERLKRLRLEKEAADGASAVNSKASRPTSAKTKPGARKGSTTLADWLDDQERTGSR
jgi:ParB-like nuclease domain